MNGKFYLELFWQWQLFLIICWKFLAIISCASIVGKLFKAFKFAIFNR